MTHFLRTKSNNTIADVDATEDDIHPGIMLREFCRFLFMEVPFFKREEFIEDMATVDDLRMTYHEVDHRKTPPDELAEKLMKPMAVKWGLYYVTD